MNNIETMKLALEALEFNVGEIGFTEVEKKALTSLRQAIEQAESITKEAEKTHRFIRQLDQAIAEAEAGPVAWMNGRGDVFKNPDDAERGQTLTPLYTTPPPREWVGLTDEDDIDWEDGGNLKDLVKAIEAKLKEKNT